jgi:hypothetical protein
MKVEGTVRSTMAGWKSKKTSKGKKASRTPGNTKGLNCQASPLDRIFATRNRSHKYQGYSEWCLRKTG